MNPPPRLSLSKARALAEKVIAELEPACARIEVAGSIRRGLAEVGDLDIVALPKVGQEMELARLFKSCAGIVETDGPYSKRCLLRKSGVQCDLWIAHHAKLELFGALPCNYGAMLLTYTGSKEHNIKLVERAKHLGKVFKPGHGVIDGEADSPRIHALTEEEIFAALDMEFIAPENRR